MIYLYPPRKPHTVLRRRPSIHKNGETIFMGNPCRTTARYLQRRASSAEIRGWFVVVFIKIIGLNAGIQSYSTKSNILVWDEFHSVNCSFIVAQRQMSQ